MASVDQTNMVNELSKLDLKPEEVDRLRECLKEEKFRNMLCEYAQEIADPKNRQLYEEEISKLERERGVDVKFVKPKPGHVLKLSVETDSGWRKCFVNICSNEHIGKPNNKPSVQEGRRGMQWSIPHSVSQPREDKDKTGNPCTVVDVVFHPDTYYLLQKNDRFQTMIHDTALEAIERQHKLKLNRSDIKKPKLKFKGQPTASVIRTPIEGEELKSEEFLHDPLKPSLPNVQEQTKKKTGNKSGGTKPRTSAKKKEKSERSVRTRTATFEDGVKAELKEILGLDEMEKKDYVEPVYSIVYRGYSDFQDHAITHGNTEVKSTRPRELVITIELPLLRSASGLRLEIFEERVVMECEKPPYKLNLKLPYACDDNKGHAKFDKSKRRLTLTLEVLPPPNERGFSGLMLVSREMKDACNSCVQDEMSRLAESLSTDDDVPQKEEPEPAKEEVHVLQSYRPSDHPSGLLHDGLENTHNQHGDLWGKDYEKNWLDSFTADIDMGELKHTSDELVNLIERLDAGSQPQFVRRRPSVRFHQDEAFVVVIISVKQIDPNTVWYNAGPTMLQMCCTSKSREPRWRDSIFQVWVKWDDTLADPRRSRVDITTGNAVFLLRKHISSWREWPYLKTGFDEKHCEIRTFATETNVNNLISNIESGCAASKSVAIDCEVIADDEEVDLFALRLKDKTPRNDNNGTGDKKDENEPQKPKSCINEPTPITSPVIKRLDDKKSNEATPLVNGDAKVADSNQQDNGSDVQSDDDDSDKYETAESSEEGQKEPPKKVHFQDKISTTEPTNDDSDDNEDEPIRREKPVEGIVTVADGGGPINEVIMDHRTQSAVTLDNSVLYELDDDI